MDEIWVKPYLFVFKWRLPPYCLPTLLLLVPLRLLLLLVPLRLLLLLVPLRLLLLLVPLRLLLLLVPLRCFFCWRLCAASSAGASAAASSDFAAFASKRSFAFVPNSAFFGLFFQFLVERLLLLACVLFYLWVELRDPANV